MGSSTPDKSLHWKGERCSDGKPSKVRLTGLAAVNTMGEKLPMFVIEKSVKESCFSGVKSLPSRYSAQKHSWMDGDLCTK